MDYYEVCFIRNLLVIHVPVGDMNYNLIMSVADNFLYVLNDNLSAFYNDTSF
jgi:hypothetical protein